jgi:hypothetical protein
MGSPQRSWTAIAFVLLTLAVIQACDSGRNTGPTTNSALQLKLHRVGGAEIPAGCTGVYSVSGPGVNIQNAALPASGQISFQGQVGQTYTVTVTLSCGGQTLTGSAQITLQPGGNTATIELTVSKVTGVACSPNPVQPGQDSTCTCNVQSPGAPSITWTGATPTSGNQARFNNTTPGTYGVTCSVNGVANGSTSVTVANNNVGRITVNSTFEEETLSVTFVPGSAGPMTVGPGGSKTQDNVPAGSYTAHAMWCTECGCSVPFTLGVGQTEVLTFPSDCD